MLGAWGLWVGAWAIVLLIWGESLAPLIAFGAAALTATLVAGYLVISPPRADPPRVLPDTSVAPPLIGAGLALLANGLAFGLWLILVGAEVAAFGLGLLFAEMRRERAR